MNRPHRGEWLTAPRFALLLALAFLLAYPEVLVGLKSFWRRDFANWGYPNVQYASQSFWRGELPLWNPFSDCGTPFLAQWGTICLYPGTLIYLLLPLPWSLNLFCLLHLWLGGLTMFFLARRWTGSPVGAAVAGLAFAYSGLTQACLEWPHYCAAVAWTPAIILLVEPAWVKGGRAVVVAAFACAMQMLTGAPEILMMTGLAVGALWLACWNQPRADLRSKAGVPPAWTSAGRLLLVGLLALGLVAIQFLPFLELITQSQRSEGIDVRQWPMGATGMANLLFPLFGCVRDSFGSYRHHTQDFFASTYLGAVVVFLAVCGAVSRPRRRPWLLALLAGAGAALAMGRTGPAFVLAKALLPSMAVPRYPAKFLLLTAWTVPLLAAYAFAFASRPGKPRQVAWVVGLGVLFLGCDFVLGRAYKLPPAFWGNVGVRALLFLSFAALLWWLRRTPEPAKVGTTLRQAAWLLALLAVMWVDYRTHLPGLNPVVRPELLAGGPPGKRQELTLGSGRLFSDRKVMVALRKVVDTDTDERARRLRTTAGANLNLLDGVPKVDGGMVVKVRQQHAIQKAIMESTNAPPRPLLEFLGVTWTLSATGLGTWEPYPGGMPLVTAGQAPVLRPENETLDLVLSPSFDPRNEVLLNAAEASVASGRRRANASVESLEFDRHRVAFEVQSDAPTLAVISQTWHRWWRARLDGEPAGPVLRANHAFQAVPVPAGRHRVVLEYVDRAFQVGAVISLTSLAVCAWLWGRNPRPAAPVGVQNPEG